MDKNEILNSSCDVRRSAAGNPNTPVEVLTELAKDGDWGVRCRAAGNRKPLKVVDLDVCNGPVGRSTVG